MSNLSSFAELIKEAAEDKKRRQLIEAERKNKEVVPLLAELFSAVAKAKAPIEPEPVKPVVKAKTPAIAKVIAPPKEVESKVEAKAKVPESEPKLLNLFNRLQADFQTLKKYVESKSGSYSGGSGGSGEVRILRMDDVVKETPVDGSVMTWDAAQTKFKFVLPLNNSGTTTTDEEMPFAKRTDFVNENEIYKGESVVGSLEDAPVWRIRKIIIASDSDITEKWANGNSLYDKVWNDRVNLIYI